MKAEERQQHIDTLKRLLGPYTTSKFDALTAAIAALEREGQMESKLHDYETRLFRSGEMFISPCFKCRYNGPGYFNSNMHSCAIHHHELTQSKSND